MPTGRERPRLGLAVSDNTRNQQARIVECSTEGMRQGVPELASLVDRPRRLRRGVARNPARKGELPEQPPQPLLVAADMRIELRIRAFEIGVRDVRRPAMAGPVTKIASMSRSRMARFRCT